MSKNSTLGELCSQVQPVYGVDASTALIAAANPSELTRALRHAEGETAVALVWAGDDLPDAAEQRLREAIDNPDSSQEDIDSAREWLEERLSIQEFYEVVENGLTLQEDTAHDIRKRRQKLSRPARMAATALCALSFGVASDGIVAQPLRDSAHQAAINPKASERNSNLTSSDKEFIVFMDGVLSGVGGGVGYMVGLAISGTVARRRAQGIVREARQGQNA